ncbi:MAG: ArnT family glycosyltransferase [Terriglobia bacterium]
MRRPARVLAVLPLIFASMLLAHYPFLRLPYFWDEAGYYIPAALDFCRHGWLIPRDTLPSGHTPLVMIYLGGLWRLFGFSQVVTRGAMILVAAATAVITYVLGRRVAGREVGIWSAILLALSPLFFAQSSLVFLDLTVACFTGLSVLFLLEERWRLFALSAVLAVMSKETAAVMLPVMWSFAFFRRKERRTIAWIALTAPAAALAGWAVYYHHFTGFWTGNAQYLQYNLYSALTVAHVLRSLVARIAEIFIQGFNWLLTAGAVIGFVWARRPRRAITDKAAEPKDPIPQSRRFRVDFMILSVALGAGYVLMLSLVGGAVLARYVLPVMPLFMVFCVALIARLPPHTAHAWFLAAAACFVACWFINPPYPFPYENNLSYVDFIRLHQAAARYLESLPGNPVILTAWPATDELRQPFLGYVKRPLRVAQTDDFTSANFRNLPPFDVLYLYSRKWEPRYNLLTRIRLLRQVAARFYGYSPPVSARDLRTPFHLKLLKQMERRGQWVRIYARQ